jgi:predicted permease
MSWWQRLRQRDRLEAELSAELADHIERQVADLVASGVPEAEARRQAKLALGPEGTAEACRDARGTRWLDELGADLRYGWRGLRQRPAFAAVAVLSLALGIGANSALFSIVDSLIRKSLPVRDPESLVRLDGGSWTNPIWEQIRERQHALFDGAFASSSTRFDLAAGGEERPVRGLYVSGGFFEVLGVPAQLGRTILPSDDARGGGPDGLTAVVSDAFWRRHYGGAPDIVGRSLRLNRVSFTIVGVTPPGFFGPEVGTAYDVAVPIAAQPTLRHPRDGLDNRNWWWLEIVARRKAGQTTAQATDALRAVQAQIRAATLPEKGTPEDIAEYLREAVTLVPAATGSSALRDRYRRPLLTILAVAGLVLLVACANVANLQLARGSERQPEFRMRLALGASRLRIGRQLLTESLLISGLGALLGLAFAVWGSRLLVRKLSPTGSVSLGLPLDADMLLFTGAIAVTTALLFGTLPAWRAGKSDPEGALREQARGPSGTSGAGASGVLVAAQVAVSLVLLVAAGLFLRTLQAITSRDLGFRPEGVLVVAMDASRSGIAGNRFVPFLERIRDSVGQMPGVASAGLSDVTPVSGGTWTEQFELVGGDGQGKEKAFVHAITPGWLSVYGTPIVAGRDVLESDRAGTPPVALVNRAFVRKVFGEKNPLGQTIRTRGEYLNPMEVVGVVEDAIYQAVREDFAPTVYVPFAQGMIGEIPPHGSLSVRAVSGSPSRLAPDVAAAIGRIDPNVTLRFRPLADQIGGALVRERLVAILAGFFGALALLLAAIGLYGVTSHAVSRRRAEIGVRMALGADAGRVARLMLGRLAGLVLIGVLAGAALSAWASRFVATLLYGLKPGDPITIAAAAALLVGITLLAAYVPARRAARIDPAKVLREG